MRRSSTSPAGEPLVRIRDADDLVVAVPHLLGFVPRCCVVLVAMGHGRIALTARFDLPEPVEQTDPDRSWVASLADAVRHAGGRRVHVLVYPPEPAEPGPAGPARRGLARVLAAGFEEAGLSLGDVLCVVDDGATTRYWAYDCDDPGCCPAQGRLVDGGTSGELRAGFVGMGRAVLPDRAAVIAQLAPADPADPAVVLLAAAVDAAAARLVEPRRGEWARAAAVRLDAALHRCAGAVPVGHLSVDEAAELIVVSQSDVPTRDVLIGAVVRRDELPGSFDVLAPVVRRGGELVGGGIAAMAATLAYLDGNGVLTAAAVERALRVQPTQSMARLLAGCLTAGLPPDELREEFAVLPSPGSWDGEPISVTELRRLLGRRSA